MPNDNARSTRAIVCIVCGGPLKGHQQKYCNRNKCQAKKARTRAEYHRDKTAQKRREQFKKEIQGRTCDGCGDPLGDGYRRKARFHGDPCRGLFNAKRAK